MLCWKSFRHLCHHIYAIISVYDIYAKISVYDIKICALNAPLIFQIVFMNESWGQLLTKITQILVRLGILDVKYVIFINVYTTSLLKSSLFHSLRYLWVNVYKGKGISGCDHYINFKWDIRHRLHCLVSTDTYLFNHTQGKSYLLNQRWRRRYVLSVRKPNRFQHQYLQCWAPVYPLRGWHSCPRAQAQGTMGAGTITTLLGLGTPCQRYGARDFFFGIEWTKTRRYTGHRGWGCLLVLFQSQYVRGGTEAPL